MKTVVVIHTGPVTVEPLKRQFRELLPDVRVVNIMDDSLLNDVMAAGKLTKEVSQRIYTYMETGQSMGANVILNACSSVGEASDHIKSLINIPIIKIDEAMADQASEIGSRIGVVATVKTTLDPTVRLIRKKAHQKGKEIAVEERLVSEAFQALLKGNGEEHDRLLKEVIIGLSEEVDVIVLAQVSMARLVDSMSGVNIPILSSPRSGTEAVKQFLES